MNDVASYHLEPCLTSMRMTFKEDSLVDGILIRHCLAPLTRVILSPIVSPLPDISETPAVKPLDPSILMFG